METKTVMMPRELTAENGAKALMSGEFYSEIVQPNPDYCGCNQSDCDYCLEGMGEGVEEMITVSVPVSWPTIKAIYSMAVNLLGE